MKQSEIIVGIDLGTTNSEVAVYENGSVIVIEGDDGKILPSYVGLDDTGELLVGAAARNQYVVYPERTVKSVKRMMGRPEKIRLGDEEYTPQEISAMILRKLKNSAEKHLGRPVKKAVITVPAFFSDIQRQATREAGEIAGLEVVKMINEPTAATLMYESSHKSNKKVLVYDLGGGTFDVSVVMIEDDVIEVVASHGNNALGGDDFDALLEEVIRERVAEETGGQELDIQALARIRRAAEDAKKQLSTKPFAKVEEEYLLQVDGAPYHLNMELSRHDYEEMITPLVDETMDGVHVVLKDADMVVADIDEVLLVGGSTRTPLVQDRLEKEFGFAPRHELDPDLCVACGAALQAAMIAGREVRAILVDITPYTFGTSALGEVDGDFSLTKFVPLIKKNTPIPVTRSEVFFTAVDGQEEVEVKVCQGEAADALDNIEVGRFMVTGLQPMPAGNEIIVTFSLDTNGILQVSAMEKATGLEKSIIIENALSDMSDQSLAKARAKVISLFGDQEKDGGQPEDESGTGDACEKLKGEAQALMEKARALLDTAGEEDREDLVNLIEDIRNALGIGDVDAVREAMEELSEIIFYLES